MIQLSDIERYIQEGDIDALDLLVDELNQSTDFNLLYEAASVLAAYGFIAQADRIYESLLIHLPDEAQLKIDRASTLLELGDEDGALLLLTDVGPQDEEYVQALLALADYFQMTGMAEAAVGKIKEAYEIAPDEPVILFAYAELLLDSGKYGEASRLYLDLSEVTDEIGGISIISRLAETYSAGAAYEEAIPYYEKMLQENTSPDTLFGAAFAYFQSGNPERAVTLLDNLIEMDPDYFSAYMLAGQALSLTGEDKEAYSMFKKGIRRDEFDKELQLAAGKSALKIGLPDAAEEHMKEALALDPEYIEALITLASLYNEKERDDDLLDLLSDSKDDLEGIPLLSAFMAYAFNRTEQYENAYESYNEAYGGMKEDHEFLSSFATFLLEEGKHKEAIKIVLELVSQFPDDQHWRAFLEAQTDEEV